MFEDKLDFGEIDLFFGEVGISSLWKGKLNVNIQ